MNCRTMSGWVSMALGAVSFVVVFAAPAAGADQGTITVDGRVRSYTLHVPSALASTAPAPLVLVFHGGGGSGAQMERMTHFDAVADREGFIVAYPDGFAGNWNDGRESTVSRAHRAHIDDVGFISALIDALSTRYSIDAKRIFATGISNGGIFSHYLGARLANRIAAIGPVAGGIATDFAPQFSPSQPVSVLIMQGTADPLVPYHGGGVLHGSRGHIVDTDEAVQLWVARNGCSATPSFGTVPDTVKTDSCVADWRLWDNGQAGTAVELYRINGGGHTWPGGPQYLPRFLVGKVCRDFDAAEVLWKFFAAHPKP